MPSGEHSFTNALIHTFRDLGTRVFSVVELHAKLLMNRNIGAIPLLISLVSYGPGIRIAPPLDHTTYPSIRDTLERKVLINISFRDNMGPLNVQSWTEWLSKHAPYSLQSVKILEIMPEESRISHGTLNTADESDLVMEVTLEDSAMPDIQPWTSWLGNAPQEIDNLEVLIEKVEAKTNSSKEEPPAPFVRSLNISSEIVEAFPTRDGRHSQVSVLLLLLKVEDPALGLREELEDLKDVFANQFNFIYMEHLSERNSP